MRYEQQIVCPCSGSVEKVLVNSKDRVYEWEPLFVIRTEQGNTTEVSVGASGQLNKVNVQIQQDVREGIVLASLQEDNFVSGSD